MKSDLLPKSMPEVCKPNWQTLPKKQFQRRYKKIQAWIGEWKVIGLRDPVNGKSLSHGLILEILHQRLDMEKRFARLLYMFRQQKRKSETMTRTIYDLTDIIEAKNDRLKTNNAEICNALGNFAGPKADHLDNLSAIRSLVSQAIEPQTKIHKAINSLMQCIQELKSSRQPHVGQSVEQLVLQSRRLTAESHKMAAFLVAKGLEEELSQFGQRQGYEG